MTLSTERFTDRELNADATTKLKSIVSTNDVANNVANGATKPLTDVLTSQITNGEADAEPALASIEATAAYKQNPVAYELSKLPFLSSRRVKVIIAGAGASALSFAHEVETGKLKNIDFQIFEKNTGLGGTWFENRYPGCACDIPSHAYLFTWAPNPKWSEYYVSAPEILQYLEDVAETHRLRQYITTSRKVVGAYWLEDKQKWQIRTKHTDGRRSVVSSYGVSEGEVGGGIIDEGDIFSLMIHAQGLC